MAFNIQSFKTNIASEGYVKTNNFEVYFSLPKVLQNQSLQRRNYNPFGTNQVISADPMSLVSNKMTMRAERVKLPGTSLMTYDDPHYGIGTTQKQPYNATFADNLITFICDSKGLLYQFWYNWFRSIYNFNGTYLSNSLNATPGSTSSTKPDFEFAYKDDFSTTIEIVLYDPFGGVVNKIALFNAFPNVLSDTPLDWNEQNNLVRIGVGITYKEFVIEGAGNDFS